MRLGQRNDSHHTLNEILEENDKIPSRDLAIGIMFLSQTVIGILGNFSLLYRYFFLHQMESKMRPIYLILRHLFIANSLTILSKGLPQTMVAFGLKHLFNDFCCKLNLYVLRVGRAMSVSTMCLLSFFQYITLSPMNSCWKNLKIKAAKYIDFSMSLCWLLHIGINSIFPLYVLHISKNPESRNNTSIRYMEICSILDYGTNMGPVYIALVVSPEVSFIVITIWACGSMILLLYRHKMQVKHIHSSNVSSRSPESRATKSILFLVSTFVLFYIISSIFYIFVALFYNLSWWLKNISGIISVCFPVISPFLIMKQNSSISMFWFVWIRNTKFPFLMKNT
ncbi:vomeronasal 1 receptor cavPorV1R636 [Cavia porcellus]|uniref:vomeronasal 1 receptor cavPorV1R636 n=1 Tax=Cavia porcellus TaxID=10141 RepID=UPI0001CF7419|nr:vomeronasal 1 receptor cavPorV1R636 [Cavia porcellus]